jgi:hypothetical protein
MTPSSSGGGGGGDKGQEGTEPQCTTPEPSEDENMAQLTKVPLNVDYILPF